MTVPDLSLMMPCDRDAIGDCRVHDHGTIQDRLARNGRCPVCRAPLDYQVERQGADWRIGAICLRQDSHEDGWPLGALA